MYEEKNTKIERKNKKRLAFKFFFTTTQLLQFFSIITFHFISILIYFIELIIRFVYLAVMKKKK